MTKRAKTTATKSASPSVPYQTSMEPYDDDLTNFEAHGAAPLPVTSDRGTWSTTALASGTRLMGPGFL